MSDNESNNAPPTPTDEELLAQYEEGNAANPFWGAAYRTQNRALFERVAARNAPPPTPPTPEQLAVAEQIRRNDEGTALERVKLIAELETLSRVNPVLAAHFRLRHKLY